MCMFWSQSKKVITDEKLIDSFLNRGLENVFPNKEVPENIQEIEIKKDTPIRDKIAE